MGEAPEGHDLTRTCPKARWRRQGEGPAEYGVPGLPLCAAVTHDGPDGPYDWGYAVRCHVAEKQVRGRRHNLSDGLAEARAWLGTMACPGNHQGTPENPTGTPGPAATPP